MSHRHGRIAIDRVRHRAASARQIALDRWRAAIGGPSPPPDLVATAGRLTVNFHPDRVARTGVVADGLLESGRYRSQWATGISSGGRTAFVGGDRQSFERTLFDGAYDDADPTRDEFPVYGAFDLVRDPLGGSPRFGSSYLVLADHVRDRTTLTLGDSHVAPADNATFDEPWPLLAGLAEQAATGRLLGRDLGVDDLLALLRSGGEERPTDRDLDHYVEAQIHGGVRLDDDVAEVVLDPSFRATAIEASIAAAADRHGVDLSWHRGSELDADRVPDDFRGPTMPDLARRVARSDGVVDAHAIGVAARRAVVGELQPDGDPPDSDLQQLKYLWHTLVAFGHDAA